MDNLQPHKNAGVIEAIEAVGARVVPLPPYSPDEAPIEELFSKVKGFLRTAAARTTTAVIAAMFGFAGGSYVAADFVTGQLLAALAVGGVACLPVRPWLADRRPAWGDVVLVPAAVGLVLAVSEIWLAGNTYSAFIYFRF